MRIGLYAMLMIGIISTSANGQQRQTVFSVDSRIGYSTNTYLNPYLSEWDRGVDSGYGVVSVLGQSAWFDSKNIFELSGGAIIEPFIGSKKAWKGGLGLVSYQRNFTPRLSGGIEAGASYFTSSFDRTLFWALPTLTWLPTPFTRLKVKAGSNRRAYDDFVVDGTATNSSSRVDLYSVEFETWPSFRWQIGARLSGRLNTLPDIQQGFSSSLSAGYIFDRGERVRVTFGLEQYQNEQTVSEPGNGFPPIGGGGPGSTEIEQSNRMVRIGLEGSLPVSNLLTLYANLEGMRYHSSATGESVSDIQVSGGVRLTLQPFSRDRKEGINPQWEEREDRLFVEIRHAGEGQLYIVGDFNDWTRPGIPLVKREGNRYVAELKLESGAYEYKVLQVNMGEERWLEFSGDTYTVQDGFGGENALILIEN